jgi:hypothetical protein
MLFGRIGGLRPTLSNPEGVNSREMGLSPELEALVRRAFREMRLFGSVSAKTRAAIDRHRKGK